MFNAIDFSWRPLMQRQAVDPATGVLYMSVPPPGHMRYTTNRPNLHSQLAATAIGTTTVAFLAVALRLFTRTHVTKATLGLDDFMVIIAMMFSFALLGMNFKHMAVGLGYHFWDVPMDDYMVPFQVFTLAGTMVYSLSLAFSKISILLLYLRLSPVRWFRVLVWLLLCVVVTYALVYNIISVFGCRPIAATWDLKLLASAKCMDQLTKYMALSILNIIIDVFELLLPIPVVLPLQMPLKQKLSICLVFATGIFVCAVAIRRTTLLPPLLVSTDYTWDAVEQFQWCFIEVNAGILCASIPALRSFFARYLPGVFSSRFGSHDRSTNKQSRSNGTFDVIAEDNKIKHLGKKDAYELSSRDESWADMPAKPDDEARLWLTDKKGWEGFNVERRTSITLTSVDMKSMQPESLDDFPPPRM